MHRFRLSLLLVVLLTCFGLQLLLLVGTVASETVASYYPTAYNLLGETDYVSGSLSDLQSENDSYVVFRSYASQLSAQSLYVHQETTMINDTGYSRLELENADGYGSDLVASVSFTGRQLWGRFVYPLVGVTSIPSSTWAFNYRTWHSEVPEEVSTSSAALAGIGSWGNPSEAYASDDTYAYSSTPNAVQRYAFYSFDVPSTARITKVEVGYEAHTSEDEQLGITLSWNGGTAWATEHVSPPLETIDPDSVTWVDFSNATDWTANKLSDGVFFSRVKAVRVGISMGDIFVDWLPVRVTYISNLPSAHASVNVLVRKSDGQIRQAIASHVANSGAISATPLTLVGNYSWSSYTVVNDTDYLEVDYFLDVEGASNGVSAFLRIDDVSLILADQTRLEGVILPTEYTMEAEFSGSSNTDYWSQILWVIESAWSTDHVSVTLQLYNYTLNAYSTNGEGYIEYASSAISETDETKSQAITANPKDFRSPLGNWKMKIRGSKTTTIQFHLMADLVKYEATSIEPPDIAISDVTCSSDTIYLGQALTINVTVINEGERTETFYVTLLCNDTQIGKQLVSDLAPGVNAKLTFNWNVTGISSGTYTVKAIADTVPGEFNTSDNTYIDGTVAILDSSTATRDVTILSITVPYSEIQVGQSVNVSVTVKNEGTETEAFNVSLCCDNTEVEKQSVSNLAPDTNAILTFIWNTTGVSLGSHTITAVADLVPGEVDVADNTLSGGALTILPVHQDDPFLPLFILLVGTGAGGTIAGILLTKSRKGPKLASFDYFDEMVSGGIPVGSSVLITGGTAAGKSILCQQLAYKYLTEKKACVFISYDNLPDRIRKNTKTFGWDLHKYEQEGALVFVDCYSSLAGKSSHERHSVQQRFALTELSIAMSTAWGEIKGGPKALFLDSATSLFTNLDASRVIGFLQDRSAKIKADGGIFVFTFGKGTLEPNFVNRLEEVVDCIIELEIHEEKGINLKRMRVKKLRGQGHLKGSVAFLVEPNRGIVFLRPRKS